MPTCLARCPNPIKSWPHGCLLLQLFCQETGLPEKKPALNHLFIASEREGTCIPVVEIDMAAGVGSYNPDYLSEIEAVFLRHVLLKGKKKATLSGRTHPRREKIGACPF